MNRKKCWVVAADTETYGRVYLWDYAGSHFNDVERKVMEGNAPGEKLPNTLQARLDCLEWEIVCLEVREISQTGDY